MKNYAIVKIAGFQYKVSEGDELEIPRIASDKEKNLNFEEVLLISHEGKTKIGQPLIKGAQVKAKIIEQTKGEKIRVATFKAKARQRKVKGFRASLTKIKIEKIISS